MYAVSFIYSNLSPHCFPFSSFQSKFFSIRGQRNFFNVTTVNDHLFRGFYRFPHCPRIWPLVRIPVIKQFNPKALYFRHPAVYKVGWQRSMMRPPRTRMKNGPPFIINRLSPWGSSRGGVFLKCSNIYTPHPKTDPYQGMLKIYLPSRETPHILGTRMLYHVWLCSCHPCDITLLFSSLSLTI